MYPLKNFRSSGQFDQVECLRLEYENTTQQHPDADAVKRPVWRVHRGATLLDGSPQTERCQRGNIQDHNYCTSVPPGIP
jgi:hypothetical protein